MSREEILSSIKELEHIQDLKNYKFGLAGSFARGDSDDLSDLDIVVNSDEMTMPLMNLIKSHFTNQTVDVLCLGLLKKEDEELDSFLLENGLPANNESVYKIINKEVIWVE